MLRLNNYVVNEYIRQEKDYDFSYWEFYWKLSSSVSSIILGAIESDINRPSMKLEAKIEDMKKLMKKEKEAQQLLNLIVEAEMEYLNPEKRRMGGKL